MSVLSVIESVGGDLVSFAKKIADDAKKLKAAWNIISDPATRALLLKIGSDAIQMVNDAGLALQADGINLKLDSAVVADIKALIADAKAGEGVIASDLKTLGIIFKTPTTTTVTIPTTNAATGK